MHNGPARSLTDAELPIPAVYDVDVAALERTALMADVPTALHRIDDMLRMRVPRSDPQAELAGSIVDEVVADRRLGRVEEVASRFGLPVRH